MCSLMLKKIHLLDTEQCASILLWNYAHYVLSQHGAVHHHAPTLGDGQCAFLTVGAEVLWF